MSKAATKPSEQPTDKKGRVGVPQPHGGLLVPGAGGGPQPGSGRPPNEFRRKLQKARDRDSVEKYLKQCLDGKHGPQAFLKALEFTDERVDGKVPTPHKVDADVKVTVEVVNEAG